MDKWMAPGPLGAGHKNTPATKTCNPKWFDKANSYPISNPTAAAKGLTFTGDDLNFLARMIYAAATGIGACPDASERKNEKAADITLSGIQVAVSRADKDFALGFFSKTESDGAVWQDASDIQPKPMTWIEGAREAAISAVSSR